MKQRKRWLGLAAAPFALAFLAFAQPAHAQSGPYIGNCAGLPNHVTGDAIVNDTNCVVDTGGTLVVDGTLTIDADSVDVKSEIQSMGKVTIRTNGGGELKLRKKASSQNNDILLQAATNRVETKGLEAGNSVQVDAGLLGAEGATWDIKVDGTIIVNKIQSNQSPDVHANVLLRAAGPINTKTIRTDGGLGASASIKSGGVQIEAYRNGGTAPNGAEFVIGGTGAANGVNGDIITGSTVGGGTSPSNVIGGLYVTMGGPTSTGAIRVADMSAIRVRATQSRSGFIIFNANAGTIYLPEGNLNSSGDTTNNTGAGLIFLLAKTLDTQPGTVISANQTDTAAGTGHQIFICVETLKYRGNGTDGLKILNDGNGGGGFFSLVNISPKGYLVPGMLTSNVNQMPWTFTLSSGELAKDGALTLDGTEGNASLVLRADGNTAAVNVSGYPLTFSGGDVTVRSRGQTLHRINVGFFGTVNGVREGLTVNNTGNWILDANAEPGSQAAAGGIVQVFADKTTFKAPIQRIQAEGPATGDGDGGTIYFKTSFTELADTAKAQFEANAAAVGKGNAVFKPLTDVNGHAITFDTKDAKSGDSPLLVFGKSDFSFSANGGQGGGNAGSIKITTTKNARIRNQAAVISAVSNGDSGNGGAVQVNAEKFRFVSPTQQGVLYNVSIKTSALSGSGDGGRIELKATTSGTKLDANGQTTLGPINVNALMKVEPAGNNASFLGSIQINGVTCQQQSTGLNVYPRTYWNCVHQTNPTGEEALVADGANSLPANLKQIVQQTNVGLSNDNRTVQIYAMDTIDSFLSYFNEPTPATGTLGVYGYGSNFFRVAAAFIRVDTAGGLVNARDAANSQTVVAGSMVHELGHHLDYIWGSPSTKLPFALPKNDPPAPNYVESDFNRLINSGSCTNAFTAQTCANPPAGTNNFERYQNLKFETDPRELFPYVFENLIRATTGNPPAYSVNPDLETVISSQFLDMSTYIQGLINQPPPSVN